MPLTGRNTLEVPPWTPGFLERFQVATEPVAHLFKPQALQLQRKSQSGGSLRTDKIILTFHQNVTPGFGWKPVGVLQLFPCLASQLQAAPLTLATWF